MRLFYKYKTTDYENTTLKAVTWNNIRKSVELQVCAKLYAHILRFRPRILFICEMSAENELIQFGFSSDLVYM